LDCIVAVCSKFSYFIGHVKGCFVQQKNTVARALIALLFLSVIWGYNWIAIKLALPFIGAFQFGAIRSFFAAMFLFALLLLLKKPLKPVEIPSTIIIGLMQTTGFLAFSIWALVSGGAGKVAVLVFVMPFWVMILAWPMLGEKIRGLQWLAVALSFVGLLFIVAPWNFHSSWLSNLLAILAGISWAIAVILAKKLHQRAPDMDLLAFTAWQMFFGSLPLVLLALLIPGKPIVWSTTLIWVTWFNIIFANGLGWLIWLYALQRLPAGVASMNSMLIPVIAVLAAWVQLGEVPNITEAVGMLLIVCALVMIALIGMAKHEATQADKPCTG
jgi:drug/metabolite transporter (DMT)-like permease